MYAITTEKELLEEAELVKNFVVLKGFSTNQLINLAINLKDKNNVLSDIYWLDGSDHLNYPSFESIILAPRFVLVGKEMRSQIDGLIFPQAEPIILVIENFHHLATEDQEEYINTICKREENDYHPHNYLDTDSIVILGISDSFEMPKINNKLDVRTLSNVRSV
jgi:hypothetical protein